MINVFKAFNFNGGEKLEGIELASAMDAFEKIDSQFGNGDKNSPNPNWKKVQPGSIKNSA